jgi:hypothetical protein
MSIVLMGSTSGSCTLQEQAVAGTTTLTLPTTSGTVALTSDISAITDYGAIGSYVIAGEDNYTAGLERLPNVTVAGSTLIRTTATGTQTFSINSTGSLAISNSLVASLGFSGTWRRMTRSLNPSSGNSSAVNLYVRIS